MSSNSIFWNYSKMLKAIDKVSFHATSRNTIFVKSRSMYINFILGSNRAAKPQSKCSLRAYTATKSLLRIDSKLKIKWISVV